VEYYNKVPLTSSDFRHFCSTCTLLQDFHTPRNIFSLFSSLPRASRLILVANYDCAGYMVTFGTDSFSPLIPLYAFIVLLISCILPQSKFLCSSETMANSLERQNNSILPILTEIYPRSQNKQPGQEPQFEIPSL